MAEYIEKKRARDAVAALSIRRFELSNAYPVYIEALRNVDAEIVKLPAEDVAPVARWISVKTQLPQDGEWVLVWHTGYKTPKKARFKVDAWDNFQLDGGGTSYIEIDGYADREGTVTHWLPLPGPPREEECITSSLKG